MNRIAIFASYDKAGVIAPYIVYYLKELNKVVDKIIFIADNEVNPSETDKIKDIVTYYQCTRHGCYDFGSYKIGFEWAESNGLLDSADELIFCNDSCYGPVYPFEKSFSEMGTRECDFWGMVSSKQVRYHLQSFFLVFKKNVFSSVEFKSFVQQFKKLNTFWDYVLMYETSFTEYLCNHGFKCSSLINCDDFETKFNNSPVNPTFFPKSVLNKGLPLIKRKMFGYKHLTLLKESVFEMLEILKSVNELVYNMIWQEVNAVVLVPIYKEKLTAEEKSSLLQLLKILSRHDIRFVCPEGLDTSHYDEIVGLSLPKERFPKNFFNGIEGYNNLMTDVSFYKRFHSYEYMLIYQLDAWVFSDRLSEWCKKGYDYVGAPWFEAYKSYEEGYPLWCCGNGGFSLRKISKFIEVTNPHTLINPNRKGINGLKDIFTRRNTMAHYRKTHSYLWEDTYFCDGLDGTCHEMYRPSAKDAAMFSFECSPQYLYNIVGRKLPFGCHAWKRYQYDEFWSEFIHFKRNKISIVTVNYNNLEGLRNTRDSIIAQTYKNYEWIVIDGGSTDGSREFLQEHSSEMSFWCSEKDSGVYNAQNKGTMHSEGDYVIYMNSGDTFHDAQVLADIFVENRDEDILYGDWTQVFPNGVNKYITPTSDVDYLFFQNDNICHQAMFIKTHLLKESPYDETYKVYADWAKWAELSFKGKSFKYVPRVVCDFLMGGLCCSNEQENEKELNRIREEFYPHSLMTYNGSQIRFLESKRKEHNKIIRILGYLCILSFFLNIVLFVCLLCL